jgi:hypothetical protein
MLSNFTLTVHCSAVPVDGRLHVHFRDRLESSYQFFLSTWLVSLDS